MNKFKHQNYLISAVYVKGTFKIGSKKGSLPVSQKAKLHKHNYKHLPQYLTDIVTTVIALIWRKAMWLTIN